MARPIVALRIDFKGEEVQVTSLAQTPRGTKYPTGMIVKSFDRGSKASRKEAIKSALEAALPLPG